MKPIIDDYGVEYCGKCRTPVKFWTSTGQLFEGASESYYDYDWHKYKFCPNCGEKVDRGDGD